MSNEERKPHSRSTIAALTDEQRKEIEGWYLKENVSHKEAQRRCKEKFGTAPSHHTLTAFYQKAKRNRNNEKILRSVQEAEAVVKELAKGSPDTAQAIENVVALLAFNSAVKSQSGKEVDVKFLRQVMDVYVDARKDSREMGKFDLEREKWEFDVARMCFEHHAELLKISADKSLDEDARLLAIRRRLFGPNVPL